MAKIARLFHSNMHWNWANREFRRIYPPRKLLLLSGTSFLFLDRPDIHRLLVGQQSTCERWELIILSQISILLLQTPDMVKWISYGLHPSFRHHAACWRRQIQPPSVPGVVLEIILPWEPAASLVHLKLCIDKRRRCPQRPDGIAL